MNKTKRKSCTLETTEKCSYNLPEILQYNTPLFTSAFLRILHYNTLILTSSFLLRARGTSLGCLQRTIKKIKLITEQHNSSRCWLILTTHYMSWSILFLDHMTQVIHSGPIQYSKLNKYQQNLIHTKPRITSRQTAYWSSSFFLIWNLFRL